MTAPRRKNIRLPEFDYSSEGSYFVTIVTQDRLFLFGEVVDGEMRLNEFGKIVEEEWERSDAIRKEIELDEYVVMPNHFHAIVHIIPETKNVGDQPANICMGDRQILTYTGDRPVAPTKKSEDPAVASTEEQKNPMVASTDEQMKPPIAPTARPNGPRPKSLGALMAGFKSSVTTRINHLRGTPGSPIWQRNYYDVIITTDREYDQIAEYIFTNPLNWLSDLEYPPSAR
jgi:REP element-mobilizing transposase RayT